MEGFNWNNMLPIEDAALRVAAAYASNPSVTNPEQVTEMYERIIKKILSVRSAQAEKQWK